jgi:NAD(P)-dependent dehydrogenase (short-subunit alcohol dehydrogenase family)
MIFPSHDMKKIFLTGASSGIGLATAKALIEHGHEVWGTSRNPNRIPQMERLHPVQLDLLDRASVTNAFKSALAEATHFDVVINNAGSGHFGPAEFLDAQILEEQFRILVFSQIQLMQLALIAMREQKRGLIVNVTSLASRLPVPFMAAYNSAKAAMAAFTMSIQLELGNSDIRIVDLQPADICTDFNRTVIKGPANEPIYQQKVAKTWEATERNMSNAPKPELVARHILKLIGERNPPPRITVGDMFQTKIAPFIFRFLPQCVRVWGLKRYYGI